MQFGGLSDIDLAVLRARSVAQPYRTSTQPVRLASKKQPPTDLVCCTFPVDQVTAMIETNHPFYAGLDRSDYRLHALPTGHWPMLSRPADLADLLISLA